MISGGTWYRKLAGSKNKLVRNLRLPKLNASWALDLLSSDLLGSNYPQDTQQLLSSLRSVNHTICLYAWCRLVPCPESRVDLKINPMLLESYLSSNGNLYPKYYKETVFQSRLKESRFFRTSESSDIFFVALVFWFEVLLIPVASCRELRFCISK